MKVEKHTFTAQGEFPQMILNEFKLESAEAAVVQEVFERFAGQTSMIMGIVDIDMHVMQWICNVSSGHKWVKSPRSRPTLLADFVHSEDMARMVGDLSYFKRYEMDEFESIYKIRDRFAMYHWTWVRAIPIRRDKMGVCTHIFIQMRHLTDSIRNSHFANLMGKEQKMHQQKIFDQRLTPREKEVLMLIGDAKTDEEIANHLMLSELTVATHRRNLLRKLDLRNKVELVKFVYENGLK